LRPLGGDTLASAATAGDKDDPTASTVPLPGLPPRVGRQGSERPRSSTAVRGEEHEEAARGEAVSGRTVEGERGLQPTGDSEVLPAARGGDALPATTSAAAALDHGGGRGWDPGERLPSRTTVTARGTGDTDRDTLDAEAGMPRGGATAAAQDEEAAAGGGAPLQRVAAGRRWPCPAAAEAPQEAIQVRWWGASGAILQAPKADCGEAPSLGSSVVCVRLGCGLLRWPPPDEQQEEDEQRVGERAASCCCKDEGGEAPECNIVSSGGDLRRIGDVRPDLPKSMQTVSMESSPEPSTRRPKGGR